MERKEECLKQKEAGAEDGEFQCPQNASPFVHTRHPDPEGMESHLISKTCINVIYVQTVASSSSVSEGIFVVVSVTKVWYSALRH